MRFSPRYFALALAVLGVELCIARVPSGSLVRSYVGDTLAVVLLYAALLSVREVAQPVAALLAFGCGCAVELGQAFGLVERLGLGHVELARIAIGTHFDPFDLLAYAVALPLILVGDRRSFASNFGNLCVRLDTKSRHPSRPPGTLP